MIRTTTLIGLICSMTTGGILGVWWYLQTQQISPTPAQAQISQAYEALAEHYVEDVPERAVVNAAITGMVSALDPHSAYLAPDEYRSLNESTAGKFGGVGLEIALREGWFTVTRTVPNSPAEQAGIEQGDQIIAVDGESLRGKRLQAVVATIRGEPDTEVQLRVRRTEVSSPLMFTLTRADVDFPSVDVRETSDAVLYARISKFQFTTSQELKNKLSEALQNAQEPIRGVILDVRNNPGGTLLESVKTADLFLDGGLIVYTEGRKASTHAKYQATSGDLLNGLPMVVLINGGSASAAEVVAGALQDHKRARLLGTPTFGKGSVQTVVPLSQKNGLKITTALYFTPSGRSIHNKGIEPDTRVEGDTQTLTKQAVALLQSDDI